MYLSALTQTRPLCATWSWMGKLRVWCSFIAILGETDGHPCAMLTVWIAPTGVQGLTRSFPGLAMGAGQPEDKPICAAELLSLCACVVTWLVDLGLPCRQLGECVMIWVPVALAEFWKWEETFLLGWSRSLPVGILLWGQDKYLVWSCSAEFHVVKPWDLSGSI